MKGKKEVEREPALFSEALVAMLAKRGRSVLLKRLQSLEMVEERELVVMLSVAEEAKRQMAEAHKLTRQENVILAQAVGFLSFYLDDAIVEDWGVKV